MDSINKKSLAEKLFELSNLDGKLYDAINKILSHHYTTSPVADCDVDWYDSSLELVYWPDREEPTQEEVDKILDLGFNVIYFSMGDVCKRLTRRGEEYYTGLPRRPEEGDHWKFLAYKYKEIIDTLTENIK